MSTAGPLSDRSKKELADLARRKGVRGWDGMSKDDLVRALSRLAKPAATPAPARKPAPVAASAPNSPPARRPSRRPR